MTEGTPVSVLNLSKAYLLYQKPQDRLKQSLFKYFGKNYARMFWALRDVSFNVGRGETLGIIGRNGSGKSTLLQLIAGTIQPTKGSLAVKGRLAAMLELGAGFNPEFTGRENIFLNGAILGISEEEMRSKLDEIISFASIGEFIDQPVKLYSSGMYIRLAFAIATTISPDILIIDEALAVGDAGFVIKCMNRMNLLKNNGTTILLVTHDVQTIRSFCDTAIWLDKGRVQATGAPLDVTSQYIQFLFEGQATTPTLSAPSLYEQIAKADGVHPDTQIDLANHSNLVRWGSGEARIESFSINSGNAAGEYVFEYGQPFKIDVTAVAVEDLPSSALGMGFAFRNNKGLDIITSTTYEQSNRLPPLQAGQRVTVTFELDNILAAGDYALVLNFEDRTLSMPHYYDFIENALIFKTVSQFPIYSQVLPHVEQHVSADFGLPEV
jgi:lipopolysaccharide transport system ATP-binding protein